MIADEMKVLFDEIRADLAQLKVDITLLSYDIAMVREQLDKMEGQVNAAPQESVGLAPGTPPPNFLPPEQM